MLRNAPKSKRFLSRAKTTSNESNLSKSGIHIDSRNRTLGKQMVSSLYHIYFLYVVNTFSLLVIQTRPVFPHKSMYWSSSLLLMPYATSSTLNICPFHEIDPGLYYLYFESDGLHKPSISKRKYKLFHHSKRHISLCTAYGWDRVNFLC